MSGYEAEFRSTAEVTPAVGLGVELEYYASAGGAESAWAASREFILSFATLAGHCRVSGDVVDLGLR